MQFKHTFITHFVLNFPCVLMMGTMQKDKYLKSYIMRVFNRYGPNMCITACIRHSRCNAVNYSRDQLTCELLEVSYPGDRVVDKAGYSYSEMSTWTIDNDVCWPNPCHKRQKCVITYNNLPVCVKFVSMKDCADLNLDKNGVYTIHPNGTTGILAYCETKVDGGGWTVIQRRLDGTVDFYRNWTEYENGFGDPSGEYRLGNSNIHHLTSHGQNELRIELYDWDENMRYAKYRTFSVGDEKSLYRLNVNGYTGSAGDEMKYHNGSKFSTKDRDNDAGSNRHCAQLAQGGWWYYNCHVSNLNGVYKHGVSSKWNVVSWNDWHGDFYCLKRVVMMIRRH